MEKIVVVIMGEDCKNFAELCLNSVQSADAIIYCDGKYPFDDAENETTDYFVSQGFEWVVNGHEITTERSRWIIAQEFDQSDPLMNGKQRNFYLEIVKKNYPGWWCLALDADEVVHDFSALRRFINRPECNAPAMGRTEVGGELVPITRLFAPRMRHLVYHLAAEDSMNEIHHVGNRLFKICDELVYPLGEHNVILHSKLPVQQVKTNDVVIWHLAMTPLFHVRSRYRKNIAHSEVHSKEFLDEWYRRHLFGKYPIREVRVKELPSHLLRGFDIDPDEYYFMGRGIEAKHFIDAFHWKNFFGLTKGATVLEVGCGLGPRLAAFHVLGVEAYGLELSQWAVDHAFVQNVIVQGDITKEQIDTKKFKLVLAYDVLEHLPYELLGKAIENIKLFSSKYVLVSVPVLGDPNLENDPTHVIKESMAWWREQFVSRDFKEILAPDEFMFRHQLLIFEVPS